MAARFQSTHPLGVRHTEQIVLFVHLDVSIHAPTRGATIFVVLVLVAAWVSIHAPTRGATEQLKNGGQSNGVSIHAPTRGATSHGRAARHVRRFQSTHPLGVRPVDVDIMLGGIKVSIHAPTRGATQKLLLLLKACSFQSTHPLGVRLVLFLKFALVFGFNPRTHSGCDLRKDKSGDKFFVSIHAPTRGATIYMIIYQNDKRVSIHAPTRGATIGGTNALPAKRVSIHAPTRGATQLS